MVRISRERVAASVAAILCAVGCLSVPTCVTCGYADLPAVVCELQDRGIAEASGIAPSHANAGCYYVHNDSGDSARVFLIDREGRTRLTIRLKGAAAVDYEDISLAPGEKTGTFDVCVADIGDNNGERSSVTIYRFPEPVLSEGGASTVDVEPVAYRVRYANGPANAEAFCVHPQTGDGYVFTKRSDGCSDVYVLPAPWNADEETKLEKLLTIHFPAAPALARIATAADIAPDGSRLAVRCYLNGWEWRLGKKPDTGGFTGALKSAPCQLVLAPEKQGEALCYAADGSAILTISEGRSPTLYELPVPAARE